MTLLEALQQALDVEHQVVYGYGLVLADYRRRPGLPRVTRREGLRRLQEHQQLRDALAAQVSAAGGAPHPARAAYRSPFRLAVDTAPVLGHRLEQVAAGAAWDLVAAAPAGSPERLLGIQALAAAAQWSARWAATEPTAPVEEALPGQPGQPLAQPAASPEPGASQPSTTPTSSPSASTTASGSTS